MTQIPLHYGQALYDLALAEALTEELLKQLLALQESFAHEPRFLRLLTAPNISKQERCAIVDDSFRGKVHPYLLNFLKLLTEKGYAGYYADCCKYFENCYNEDHGIVPVYAVTAEPLTEGQTRNLTHQLARITGKQIRLHNRVDPRCLGGICLQFDGRQVDSTVKSRLESISALLKQTVL